MCHVTFHSPWRDATYRFQFQHVIDPGQDDSDNGPDVDDGHDGDHDQLTDGLLEPGHAALATDARLQRGDGNGQGNHQNLPTDERSYVRCTYVKG